ncbi:hypothetical protein P3W45_000727 [Vairimorpha bombi]
MTNKTESVSKTKPIKKRESTKKISEHILDEISIRFLIQIDPRDIENIERFFFILEEAHWFYIDNYKERVVSFLEFCTTILIHNSIKLNVQEGITKFKIYKQSIKVYGGIIFDKELENVLVVKEGKKSITFGFPKGKKNMNEDGPSCAIREIMEEIGYDVSTKIVRGVSINLFEKMNFYFVFNVSKKFAFKSCMKNEISDILWLPVWKLEEGLLGKKFSIITKSYRVWKDFYETLLRHKFHFNRFFYVHKIIHIEHGYV